MSSIAQNVAFQTLDALEQRLQRVRFLLYGSAAAAAADNDDQTPTDTTITQTQSIASRLQALQSSFNSVLSDSKSAQSIVALRISRLSHTMFPTRLTTSQNHNINTMALT